MIMADAVKLLVTHDGLRVAARDVGPASGPPVVLVAGWPQTMHAWRHVQASLAQAGIRSIALDPPGVGESDVLRRREDYATPAVAAVMAEAVATTGIEHHALVGHDIGAWIAYAWASTQPDAVTRLALVDAAIPGAMPSALPIENAPKVFQFFFNSVPDLPERLTSGREHIYLEWLFETKTVVKDAIGPDDLASYVRAYGRPGRMSAGFDYYRTAQASAATLAGADRLSMPVLAIGGEFGVGEGLATALATRSDNIESHVIAGSGHYIPEEKPAELAAQLIRFVGGERT